MLRFILSIFGFGWRRVGDAGNLSWIFPGYWGLAMSALASVATAALGYLSQIPVYLWLPLALGVALVVLAIANQLLSLWDRRRLRSVLEIHFDPRNPAGRFWSLDSPRDKDGKAVAGLWHEYRVDIFNPTNRTIRNVAVTVESFGAFLSAVRRADALFDKTRQLTCDLRPGCAELAIVLHWPHPKIQAGMLAGESALTYGPIVVTVSADDTPPTQRVFAFDYQQEPMLFDPPKQRGRV